jgi:hypothetical protein
MAEIRKECNELDDRTQYQKSGMFGSDNGNQGNRRMFGSKMRI